MPKGGGKIDAARAEYIERRAKGEKVNLRELAERAGLSYSYVRNRKREEKWDEAVPPPPKKKRGGQPGNKNSKGKKNAAGSHKGALGSREALEHEMKILKFRENKILSKIAEYEDAEEGAVYLSAMTEIRGKNNTTMRFSDSAFKRIQSLQEALYKVQGRIAKITDSLRALDESAARLELEQQRLEILRMRAANSVDVDGVEPDDLTDVEREDEK